MLGAAGTLPGRYAGLNREEDRARPWDGRLRQIGSSGAAAGAAADQTDPGASNYQMVIFLPR